MLTADRPAQVNKTTVSTTRALRIAYVMSRFPKLTETFVLLEMLAIRDEGDDIWIYPLIVETGGDRHPGVSSVVDRVRYTGLASREVARASVYFMRRKPRRVFRSLATIARENLGSPAMLLRSLAVFPKAMAMAMDMQQRDIEHIHAHFATHATTSAWVVHQLTGIPYTFTAHAHDIYVEQHMLKEKVRAASRVITISNFNREFIVRHCGPTAATSITVVRNGIDTGLFAPGAPHSARHPFTVLCVGALEEKKGQTYLIEACRQLHERGIDLRCELIGRGEMRGELQSQIDAAGLHDQIHLLGGQPRDAVAEHMRRADVVVLPSIVTAAGKTEGLPVALTEALACERPVVASRVSGIPELVTDGETGLLVEPRDAPALADALERLYLDPALRSRMGTAGRQRVLDDYDMRRNVRQLRALFAASVGA